MTSGKEDLKKAVLGIFLANKSRTLSTRAVQKIFYIKLVKFEDFRRFLGITEEDLIKVDVIAPHGPVMKEVFLTLNALISENIVEKDQVKLYKNGKEFTAGIFRLKKDFRIKELNLPFDITKLNVPPTISIENLVTEAKQELLNRFLCKNYIWKSPWNSRLAYAICRDIHVVNKLVTKNEVTKIIDLINMFDQRFNFSYLRKKPNVDVMIPSIKKLTNVMLEALRCTSFSENERHVAEIINEWVNEIAKENRIQDRIKSEIDEDGNLLVILKGQHIEKIMFVFHMDTVKGFFEPKIESGYIYGRGAVDNKCQGIAAIYSLLLLALNEIVPSLSIVVMGVTCEEINDINKRGIIKAIKRYNLSQDNTPIIVILEATNMNVAIGQRPRWTGTIKVFGPGMHSAHVENNEVKWLQKIRQGKIEAFTRFPDLRALVSRAVVELRTIPNFLGSKEFGRLGRTSIVVYEKYEDTPCNQTPSSGIVEFDIRLGDEGLKEEIRNRIKEIMNKWLPSPFGYEWNEESEKCTGISDFLNSKIGEQISALLERLKPFFEVFHAKFVTYEFGVDGRYTVEAEIPTFGLAPGDELYAHRTFNHFSQDTNVEMLERIKLLDLFEAIIIYFMLAQACKYHRAYDGKPEIRLMPTYDLDTSTTSDASNFYIV